jgi:hypothetical protein
MRITTKVIRRLLQLVCNNDEDCVFFFFLVFTLYLFIFFIYAIFYTWAYTCAIRVSTMYTQAREPHMCENAIMAYKWHVALLRRILGYRRNNHYRKGWWYLCILYMHKCYISHCIFYFIYVHYQYKSILITKMWCTTSEHIILRKD